jgi:hypothetical protein
LKFGAADDRKQKDRWRGGAEPFRLEEVFDVALAANVSPLCARRLALNIYRHSSGT